MKCIVILMDSLNKRMLDIYNKYTWTKTPNIKRLAEKSVSFDNHWIGSAPCMPARRDMFTGRLNFPERPWGPIEPFDITLPGILRDNGIFTHMVTDHYHYLEIGGEGYCQIFNTWDLYRGQHTDPWVSRVNAPELPKKYYGNLTVQYELNRTKFKNEEDFTGPKTFQSACDWLDNNSEADNWMLWVEAFDPHGPFDCPDEYVDMYEDNYAGPRFELPTYREVTEPSEALQHLRRKYAAVLTMTDKWLGKLLDKMDEYSLWDDTLVIFTTDHGLMLGEHGFTGKNYMHVYNELAHLPLIVHLPKDKRAKERINALTQNIDIMPTILDFFGLQKPECLQGKSWKGLMECTEDKIRDAAIYGYYGKAVNITDGNYTYFRAPKRSDNQPCFIYTAMPTTLKRYIGQDEADKIMTGRFLKHTNYPVFKIPATGKKYQTVGAYIKDTLLFDIKKDYTQQNPLSDIQTENRYIELLRYKLEETGAPDDQFERLGI